MEKKYLELKEVQKEELEIMKITIKFLDENNIKYYLSGGTFLGAVRHKGFIPWDDDIDLMMFRSEYDKLVKILKDKNSKISDNIEARAFELGNSDWPFMKIINKNIALDQDSNCDKNLWIDIFPLDNAKTIENEKAKKIKLYREFFAIKRYYVNKMGYKSKNIINRIAKIIMGLILKPIKYETIIKKYVEVCQEDSKYETDYVADNTWGNPSKTYKREWFEDAIYEFEGLKVNGLKNYDEFLTREYGEYMKLPDEKDRITHGVKGYRV